MLERDRECSLHKFNTFLRSPADESRQDSVHYMGCHQRDIRFEKTDFGT